MKYKICCDGGARGNPGPAATGYVIRDQDCNILEAGGSFLGTATNNIAEYKAVVEALAKLKESGAGKGDEVEISVDSQLVARQLNGLYKVKNSAIRDLVVQVRGQESNFSKVAYIQIERSKNVEADRVVNQILDQGKYGN